MRAFLHGAKEYMRIQQPSFARGCAVDLQIQPVQLLPHFRAALFAHLAQIFAGGRHAGKNRGCIGAVEGQDVSQRGRVDLAILRSRNLRGFEQAQPASGAGFGRLVEAKLQVNVDQTGRMFGALQVAAHPVQAVRDSGKHGCSSPVVHALVFTYEAITREFVMRAAPRYLCCRRPATSSPPAIRAAAPRASSLREPA